MAQNMQDRIREEAYRMWENDGCQQGKEMDYWLAAEQKVSGSKKSKAKKPAVAVVKSTKKTTAKKSTKSAKK